MKNEEECWKNENDIHDEEYGKEDKRCKRCGSKIYSRDSIDAGHCIECANRHSDSRKAWEDKGLAKFCSCGQMLHAQESMKTGKCAVCVIRDGTWNVT
jgi:hypothetical protein